jgi:hypothetical protein
MTVGEMDMGFPEAILPMILNEEAIGRFTIGRQWRHKEPGRTTKERRERRRKQRKARKITRRNRK